MAESKVKFRIQGHEKFVLRDGWINKALSIVPQTPNAFSRKDATDLFGIGNNMVKSLRYWMKAFGLMTENSTAGAKLTETGELIAKYDPYLEDPFTLWIMHSNIAKNEAEATTWFLFFNYCDSGDFDKTEIEKIVLRELKKYVMGQTFSEKSLGNDIDVLLNMYSKTKEKTDPEDKSNSPLAQLSLLKNVEGRYVRIHPDRRILSELVVLYELISMMGDSDSISIEDAITGKNGLAKIYNLSGVMANDYLDRLDSTGLIRVNRTAGLDMIYLLQKKSRYEILKEYYSGKR